MSHREHTDPMPSLLDHYDGPLLQDGRTVGQDRGQPSEYVDCPRVVEAEDDHTRFPATRERRDLAEVKIEGENGSALRNGLGEYLAIRQSLKALVAKVQRLMALLAQPGGNADIHAHVQREFHEQISVRLPEMNLLLSEPRGIPEGLLDVLPLEVWIPGKYFLEARAVCELPHDH